MAYLGWAVEFSDHVPEVAKKVQYYVECEHLCNNMIHRHHPTMILANEISNKFHRVITISAEEFEKRISSVRIEARTPKHRGYVDLDALTKVLFG